MATKDNIVHPEVIDRSTDTTVVTVNKQQYDSCTDKCCFNLRPVDLDFIAKAQWRFVTDTEIDAAPAEVYSILLDDNAWNVWHPEITIIQWLTPEPKGVGSQRIIMFGTMKVTEEFLAIDNNARFTFRFNHLSKPTCMTFNAMVEDFILVELPNNRTRLIRTVNADPG